MIGHAVIEGIRVPVTRVSLRDGGLILWCTLTGPLPPVDGGTVTIFGEDGAGICQGYCKDVRWKDVRTGDVLHVKISMQVGYCYGDAEPAAAKETG